MQEQVTATLRMSHAHDPHTSHEAAAKVPVAQKHLIYRAVEFILDGVAMTPEEIWTVYETTLVRDNFWPSVELQEIRRRMTEMQHDHGLIEPIQVGTHRGGKPQYATRDGQRVMRLVKEP